jgi:outer membrane receptor protein involved in Fe transport
MRDIASVTSATPPPGVDAYDILDLSARLKLSERFELSAGINNLLEKSPPVVGGVAGQTTPTLYDVIGRNYFLGAKAKF